MKEFLNEFTRRYNKKKSLGTTMTDDILTYRLLESADLSEQHEQLAKATISDLKFDTMKDQLKKIFGDLSCIPPTSSSEGVIKTEQVNHLQEDCSSDQGLYFSYSRARGALRGRGHDRGRPQPSFSSRVKPKQGKNPADERGIQQGVLFANPLTTGTHNCPDKGPRDFNTYYVVLYQSDYDHPNTLKNLVVESWNAAVLDSSASKTVCGQSWLDCYIECVNESRPASVF